MAASWHLSRQPYASACVSNENLLVTREDLGTATESEPAVTLCIVCAASASRKLLASNNAKVLLDL